MPTQDWGVYQDSLTLGTQVSSTYEGRHITATAAELNHGNILGVVTKGYPVIFDIVAGAHGVGVAFNTEVLGTDLIAVDTEGIWNLAVTASDDAANSLVVAGDPLYINVNTAIISKIRNNATQIPFGYALSQGNGDGLAHTCAVKVHWDPRSHWLEDLEMLYFGDARDVNISWTGARLEMLPLGDNIDFNIGDGTNSFDVQIFGNTNAYYTLWDSALNTYDQVSLMAVAGNAHHLTLTDTSTHVAQTVGFHLNLTKTAGDITAGGELVGIASDIGLQSEASHVYAFSAYTEVTGAGSSDADFSAFRCYMNNLGGQAAQVNRYSCAQFEMNSTATASKDPALTGNSFIYFYSHGGAATQYFYIPDMLGATWMFRWASPNVAPVEASGAGLAWTHRIACQVGGLTRYIKLSSA